MPKQAADLKYLASASSFADKALISRFSSSSDVVALSGTATDTFSSTGSLSGRYTETGGLAWQGSNYTISNIGGSFRVGVTSTTPAYVDTGTPDVSLSATLRCTSVSGGYLWGLLARTDGTSSNGYAFYLIENGSVGRLYKYVNGTPTLLDSPSLGVTVTSNVDYAVRLDIVGSVIFAYFNGTLVSTYTDSDATAALLLTNTKHGFRASTATSNTYLDDFSITGTRGSTGCELTTQQTLRLQSASGIGTMDATPTIPNLSSLKSFIPTWLNRVNSVNLTSVYYSLDNGVTYNPMTNGEREFLSATALLSATSMRLRYQLARSGIMDTVNRADSSSSPGITDTGQAWSVDAGTWGVASKQLYVNSGAAIQRILMNTGSNVVDFMFEAYMASTPGSGTPFFGLHLRATGNGSFSNFIEILVTNAAITINKCVGGSYTQMATVSIANPTDVYIPWRVTVDVANLVTVYRAGASVLSATVSDASINSQTYHGFRLDLSSWTVGLANRYRNLSFYDASSIQTELESFAMALEY